VTRSAAHLVRVGSLRERRGVICCSLCSQLVQVGPFWNSGEVCEIHPTASRIMLLISLGSFIKLYKASLTWVDVLLTWHRSLSLSLSRFLEIINMASHLLNPPGTFVKLNGYWNAYLLGFKKKKKYEPLGTYFYLMLARLPLTYNTIILDQRKQPININKPLPHQKKQEWIKSK